MPDVTIDWLGIVVAAVAAMIIGALWYGPIFGASWLAHVGKTREELQGQGGIGYLVALLGAFFTALILTYVTQWAGAGGDFIEGMLTGAVMWVGFTLSTVVTGGVFEGKPWGLIMINSGNALLTFLITGGIVAAFA